MDNRYNRHNRRKYSLKVHIVLVTKYRKQLLKDSIADDVNDIANTYGTNMVRFCLNSIGRKKYFGQTDILVALSDLLSIDYRDTAEALLNFRGTDRRFEYKGTINGITIVDDYAHHPTEIAATLHAALNYPHKTLWCIFQPHTYTRTKAFLPQFAKSLALADKVILADIYAARETDTLGISSADLQALVQKEGKECFYFHTFEEIEDFVLKNCINGDLLITMGAGDVVNIGENLLSR